MLEMLLALHDEEGLTLKNGIAVTYKTGYQVADYGVASCDVMEAVKVVEDMNGNCGIWFNKGTYYIDHSFRVNTKKEALRIGKQHEQISVLKWSDMTLVYC